MNADEHGLDFLLASLKKRMFFNSMSNAPAMRARRVGRVRKNLCPKIEFLLTTDSSLNSTELFFPPAAETNNYLYAIFRVYPCFSVVNISVCSNLPTP
jgi:hypothetical protein